MYLLDTNIFLELILNRKNQADCEKLFEAIQDKTIKAICTRFSIYSVCILLSKDKKTLLAAKFFEYLASLENLVVVNTTMQDEIKILKLVEETKLDFDDCLQYFIALDTNCE